MDFDFNRYIEDFNRNDDEATVAKYFTEDLVLEGPDRTMHGRQEWLDALKWAHTGVKETLQPVLFLQEGDRAMAEVNAVFTSSIDRADFPFAVLKAGQPLTMKFFAAYRFRGNKICHFTLACWFPAMRSV